MRRVRQFSYRNQRNHIIWDKMIVKRFTFIIDQILYSIESRRRDRQREKSIKGRLKKDFPSTTTTTTINETCIVHFRSCKKKRKKKGKGVGRDHPSGCDYGVHFQRMFISFNASNILPFAKGQFVRINWRGRRDSPNRKIASDMNRVDFHGVPNAHKEIFPQKGRS